MIKLNMTLVLLSTFLWSSDALARDDSTPQKPLQLTGQAQNENSSLFDDLPQEVWANIISHTSLVNTQDFRLVCRDARLLSRQELLGRTESDKIEIFFRNPKHELHTNGPDSSNSTAISSTKLAKIKLENEQTKFSQTFYTNYLGEGPFLSLLPLQKLPLRITIFDWDHSQQQHQDTYNVSHFNTYVGMISRDMVFRRTETGEAASLLSINIECRTMTYKYAFIPELNLGESRNKKDRRIISLELNLLVIPPP